jgi:hypothetical protein
MWEECSLVRVLATLAAQAPNLRSDTYWLEGAEEQ